MSLSRMMVISNHCKEFMKHSHLVHIRTETSERLVVNGREVVRAEMELACGGGQLQAAHYREDYLYYSVQMPSCSCLPVLPCPDWLLLSSIYLSFFLPCAGLSGRPACSGILGGTSTTTTARSPRHPSPPHSGKLHHYSTVR